MKLVVTGNMGCGKSTVVRQLIALLQDMHPPYVHFDFDDVVATMYMDPEIQILLRAKFGTILKAEVSDIVHGNVGKMMQLRQISDLYLIEQTRAAVDHPNVIMDIPLYFEFAEQLEIQPDLVLCVVSDLDKQIERVKARSGFSQEKIVQILGAQLPQEIKASYSDYIIANVGTHEELLHKTTEFVTNCMIGPV